MVCDRRGATCEMRVFVIVFAAFGSEEVFVCFHAQLALSNAFTDVKVNGGGVESSK